MGGPSRVENEPQRAISMTAVAQVVMVTGKGQI